MLDELEELAREHMMLISNSEALGPENVGFLTQGLIFTTSSGDDNAATQQFLISIYSNRALRARACMFVYITCTSALVSVIPSALASSQPRSSHSQRQRGSQPTHS